MGRTMLWEKEIVVKLVKEYKRYPCLYNIRHAGYRDQETRRNAYYCLLRSISALRPGTNLKELKIKLKSLRTQYVTNLKALKTRKTSSKRKRRNHASPWWLSDSLSFLHRPSDDKYGDPSTNNDEQVNGNADEDEQCETESNRVTSDEESSIETGDEEVEEPSQSNNLQLVRLERPESPLTSFGPLVTAAKDALLQVCNSVKQTAPDDKFDVFGKFVGTTLKELSSQTIQRLAQRRIQAILLKAQTDDEGLSTDQSEAEYEADNVPRKTPKQ